MWIIFSQGSRTRGRPETRLNPPVRSTYSHEMNPIRVARSRMQSSSGRRAPARNFSSRKGIHKMRITRREEEGAEGGGGLAVHRVSVISVTRSCARAWRRRRRQRRTLPAIVPSGSNPLPTPSPEIRFLFRSQRECLRCPYPPSPCRKSGRFRQARRYEATVAPPCRFSFETGYKTRCGPPRSSFSNPYI